MNIIQMNEIRQRSQALTAALTAALDAPGTVNLSVFPDPLEHVRGSISAAYGPTIRTLAVDLVSTIDAALAAEPEGADT